MREAPDSGQNRGSLTVEAKEQERRALEFRIQQKNLKSWALILLRLQLPPHKHWEDSSDLSKDKRTTFAFGLPFN